MSLPTLPHFILLLLAAAFTFFWHNNPGLSQYSLQLSSLLLAVFLFHNLLGRKKITNISFIQYQSISNSLTITLLLLLLVLDTGGLTSPLFFTLDFLLFGLSLLFNPSLGLLVGLALSLLFLLNNSLIDLNSLTNLISLILVAPLARFFGTQYLRLLEGQKQIKVLKHQSNQLETNLSQEEGNTLLWLTLNFHNKMSQSLDLISQISSQLSTIPYHQQEKLKSLYLDLKELFKSGQELKDKIDKITDD